jgi:5-methyltetrahydropteroyltriglutamate--homocysteine methyltransferase
VLQELNASPIGVQNSDLPRQIPTSIVGSITRPIWLIKARKAFLAGELGREELDSLSDLAVEFTVKELEKTGLDEISDGEQRRTNFFEFLTEAVEGFEANRTPLRFGAETYYEPGVVKKLELGDPIALKELNFSKKLTNKPLKVPQPPITRLLRFYPLGGVAGYTQDQYLEDAKNLLKSEYKSLLDGGASTVQIDWPDITPYSALSDRTVAASKVKEAVELVNETIQSLPQEKLHVHVCFGNHKATHRVTGGSFRNLIPELYELRVSGYLLELANAQHEDDVEIFRDYPVPRGKRVYAGVVDVKTPDVEPVWLVKKRLERVAKFIDPSMLGATSDCGFAPGWYSYVIPRSANFQKLSAVAKAAKEFSAE